MHQNTPLLVNQTLESDNKLEATISLLKAINELDIERGLFARAYISLFYVDRKFLQAYHHLQYKSTTLNLIKLRITTCYNNYNMT